MDDEQPKAPLPPLKTDPRYGFYPWWPEDGDAWVHPEDVALARQRIPSPRIWRRDGEEGAFAMLTYGADRLRVRPALWQETPQPAFEMGDLVEVLPHGMQNDPVTGHVREVHWDEHTRQVEYQLDVADRVVETRYHESDLKHVDPTKAEPMMRIDPPDEESSTYDLLSDE